MGGGGERKMSDTKVKVAVRVRPMNRRGNRRAAPGKRGGGVPGLRGNGGGVGGCCAGRGRHRDAPEAVTAAPGCSAGLAGG